MVSTTTKEQNKIKTAQAWAAAVAARTPETQAAVQKIADVVAKQEQMANKAIQVPPAPVIAPALDESTMQPNPQPSPVQQTYISPTLQAKIDAKKPATPTPVTPAPVVEPAPVEEVKTVVEPTKIDTKVEISDVEKNAQASGVKYAMKDGTPVYSPATTEEATKILQLGGKLEDWSKVWAVAKATLDKVTGLSQMTDKQLGQNIVSGNVSAKDLQMLSATNPDLVARAKEFATKGQITSTANAISADNAAIVEGKEGTIQNKALDNLLNKVRELDANKETYWEMKARVYAQYPDMDAAKEEIVTAQTQLRELQRAKRDLYADYKKKNSSLPISMIMAGYSALSRDLDNSIYEVNDTLSQNVAVYNSYLDEANAEIEWEIGDQQAQEERLFNMYGVTSAEEIRQQDIQREDDRIQQSIDLEEQRYQRDVEREDFISAKARKEKIEDMKLEQNTNIETGLLNLGVNPSGMTPEEMRSNYASATRSQLAQQRALDYAKLDKNPDSVNNSAPQFAPVFNDDGTMKISGNSVYNLAIWPDGNSVQVQWVEEWGYAPNGRVECGAFVNDLIGTKIFGNKLSDKTKNINTTEPVVGGAFIEDVWPYGHVGFIESINEDGSINIVDSNYSSDTDGKIRRDTIAVWSPRWNQIKGFYDPSVWWAKPLDSNQRIIANAEKSAFRSNAVVKAFEEGLQQYKDIVVSLNDESWPWDTAGIFQFMKSLDPTSVVRESEFDAAAKSAGVFEYIGNTYDRVMKGKKLSPEQAMAFKRLAKSYVGNRAESYNRLYDDMARSLDNQWIHQSYYPSRATDDLLWGGQFQPTKTDLKEDDNELNDLRANISIPERKNAFGITIPS